MANNKFFQSAAWWAFASAILMILGIASVYILPKIGDILLTIFLLLLLVVFYTLYVTHRPESGGLSLAGLILAIPAVGMAIAANSIDNPLLANLYYLVFSLPFFVFGILAFRSAKMPRGLAVVTLLTGVTYLFSGVTGLLGNQVIAGSVGTLSSLLMLVWLVWLWRVFLSKRMTSAVPAPVAA